MLEMKCFPHQKLGPQGFFSNLIDHISISKERMCQSERDLAWGHRKEMRLESLA